MKKIIYFIVVLLLIAVLAISSIFLIRSKKEDDLQEDIFVEIANIAKDNMTEEQEINIKELYEINNDIIGWVKIDDTNINYPVMQTKDRLDFYLRKNFYKQYSYWGTPYLAESCDIKTSDNLIIYGHHINGSKMFGELEKYRKQDFYKNHKKIKFYTKEENAQYEVIAVFRTIAYTGFPYYKFVKTSNEDEFNAFVNKCIELSFYQTEEKAQYGDKLMTLSTCDYTSKNGRFVVVAKKIL